MKVSRTGPGSIRLTCETQEDREQLAEAFLSFYSESSPGYWNVYGTIRVEGANEFVIELQD
jgi:hypothetical protein